MLQLHQKKKKNNEFAVSADSAVSTNRSSVECYLHLGILCIPISQLKEISALLFSHEQQKHSRQYRATRNRTSKNSTCHQVRYFRRSHRNGHKPKLFLRLGVPFPKCGSFLLQQRRKTRTRVSPSCVVPPVTAGCKSGVLSLKIDVSRSASERSTEFRGPPLLWS